MDFQYSLEMKHHNYLRYSVTLETIGSSDISNNYVQFLSLVYHQGNQSRFPCLKF